MNKEWDFKNKNTILTLQGKAIDSSAIQSKQKSDNISYNIIVYRMRIMIAEL